MFDFECNKNMYTWGLVFSYSLTFRGSQMCGYFGRKSSQPEALVQAGIMLLTTAVDPQSTVYRTVFTIADKCRVSEL